MSLTWAEYYGCARKNRYRSYEKARRDAVNKQKRGAPRLYVYHCDYCDGWHLTRKPFWYDDDDTQTDGGNHR